MIPSRVAIIILLLVVAGGPVAGQPLPADVRGHWAEGRIAELLGRRLVELFPDGSFRPHEPITRARFVAWIVAVKGIPVSLPETPSFADVAATFPLAPQIEAALAHGVLTPAASFRPADPLTRVDAVHYTVRALGHTFESAYMAGTPLPFGDLAGLSAHERGAVAVAAQSSPPLLRELPSTRFRPAAPITRGEAASLLWGYLQAVEQPFVLRQTFPLTSGVRLILEKRGALRTLPVHRVQVGAFLEQERAARLADTMRARGLPAFVDVLDIYYKVRVGNFARRADAERLATALAGEGYPVWIILTLRDFDLLPGPIWSAVLVLEGTDGSRLRPALATDEVPGRERTSAIARRYDALAATNGGFFALNGDPLGCLMIDGELLSEPIRGRSCVGILRDGRVLFDVVTFDGTIATETAGSSVHGVNRERGEQEVIVYRRAHGPTTRTNAHGVEAVVAGDVVEQVIERRGNAPIPPAGYVLSGHGRSGVWIRENLKAGDRVALRLRLLPASGDPRWQDVVHVIGGGPRLLADGQYVGGEGFANGFLNRRHPRTAIARHADGRVLLVVVDGREPYHSLGATLPELAAALRALGATDAVNLDGGGSSTLVVRGTVVNLPSDEGGERPVSDALLIVRP